MSLAAPFKRCGCLRGPGRCPQLRRPDGSWSAHHGTWFYRLELPHGADRRRVLRRGGFSTRREAAEARDHATALLELADGHDTLLAEISTLLAGTRRGAALPSIEFAQERIRDHRPLSGSTTLAAYLTQWLTRCQVEPTTLNAYRGHVRTHLIPHLGHRHLDELRPGHIRDMFTAIEQTNETIRAAKASRDPAVRASVRGRRPSGAATCQRIRATLRKALNDAILDGLLLTRNPVTGTSVRADRARPIIWTQERVDHWRDTGQVPGPVMVWTPAQTGAFLDYATSHDPDLYSMLHLIAHAGLRRGEAVGLRDVDVALDRAEITMTRQRVDLGDTVRDKRPKTRGSVRTIALAASTVAVLRAARARRPQRREADVFFVRPDGRAWHPATVSRRFQKLVAEAGLPPIRLHGLRHGAATLALAAGVDLKVIQEQLGHSTLAFTADTYTSVVPELHHAAAEAVAALVPRRR
ncbi:MAG TPA: tyrosine-type recombinase/integrase [Rugosimonospora sp.]|nr:tyrosine-type recombinase/integrase [Rugosimonospora sp.]